LTDCALLSWPLLHSTKGCLKMLSEACCGKLIVIAGMQNARDVAQFLQERRAVRSSAGDRYSPSTCSEDKSGM
jgi:hypothetical protein